MSIVCEHCGSPVDNENFAVSAPLYEQDETSGGGWLCFRGSCTKSKNDRNKDAKSAKFSVETREARYQRRTIQFEVDPNSSVSSRRLPSSVSSSILKASKVGSEQTIGVRFGNKSSNFESRGMANILPITMTLTSLYSFIKVSLVGLFSPVASPINILVKVCVQIGDYFKGFSSNWLYFKWQSYLTVV